MILSSLFLLVCCIGLGQAANCNSQWNSYGTCIRTRLGDDYKNGGRPNTSQRQTIEAGITLCFNDNDCHNPIPPNPEKNGRYNCFLNVRTTMRNDLQGCIRKEINDIFFQLPEDHVDGSDWVFTYSRIQQALVDARNPDLAMCPGRLNYNVLNQCAQKLHDFRQNPGQPRDYCVIKNDCRVQAVQADCEQQWNQKIEPVLCRCSDQLNKPNLQKYQDQYETCVRNKGYSVDGGDPGPVWVSNFMSFWCQAKKDGCGAGFIGGRPNNPFNGNGFNRSPNGNQFNGFFGGGNGPLGSFFG